MYNNYTQITITDRLQWYAKILDFYILFNREIRYLGFVMGHSVHSYSFYDWFIIYYQLHKFVIFYWNKIICKENQFLYLNVTN